MSHTHELIDKAAAETGATKAVVALSGGDDSMAVLSRSIDHPMIIGALHLNTGIGVELTREHVRQTCKDVGCPLFEYCAVENVNAGGKKDPQVYEDLVLAEGFPGPTKIGHGKMYNRLKERSIERFIRDQECTSRNQLMIITGVRSQE